MSKKHLLAAIAVAVGTATALAAPAAADDQLDQAFLQAIQQKGILFGSDQDSLALAHSTCDLLNKGGTVNDALKMLTNKTKWPVQKATNFGAVAVYAYCKDKLPSSTGG